MPENKIDSLAEAKSLNNQAVKLFDSGEVSKAISQFEQAYRMGLAGAGQNVIFSHDYLDHEIGWEAHQRMRREYATTNLPWTRREYANPRTRRKLKIGYVSADFCNHSAAWCFGPVLRNHNKDHFEISLFSGTEQLDDQWQRFAEGADHFVDIRGLDAETVAQKIQELGIDILVDLSGYSAGNRLDVFALKPVPIQVTAWGHGGGTGMPQMDYQFSDETFIPDHVSKLFTETLWNLPCAIPFDPIEFCPPIQRPPHEENGFITFGNFGKRSKGNAVTVDTWMRTLAKVPNSRLLLKDGPWEHTKNRELLDYAAELYNVSSYRIITRGRTSRIQHLQHYADTDIMLDTFPQNGGVTTWEALWMGVPVITKLGNQPSSRISAAILTALGLESWICPSDVPVHEFAAECSRRDLVAFRRTIRPRIEASPAGCPQRYTWAVEEAYRAFWSRYIDN